MPDWIQIVLTTSLTLLGGVVLLITSEFVKLLVVLPLKKYRDHVEFITDRLDFYVNYLTNFFSENPSDDELELMKRIRKDLRSAATQLNAIYASISLKKLFIKFHLVPSRIDIDKIYRNLILLSNNLPIASRVVKGHDPIMVNNDAVDKIKAILHAKHD